MFSKPNSCLLLLFFLSYLHHLPCALSQPDLRLCDALFQCGNITAGFPFWGEARPEPCGHPSLELHCDQSSNKTSLIISGLVYRVLQIDNSTNTLGLVRQDFLGESFCNANFTSSKLAPELFQLLPGYKLLFVSYLCGPRFHNPANFTCPQRGVGAVTVHQNDGYNENCGGSFNITVPTSYDPEEEALNVARLVSVLTKGLKLKLMIDERPCQECKSSGGICGYDVSNPVCCRQTNSSSGFNCGRIIQYESGGKFLNCQQTS